MATKYIDKDYGADSSTALTSDTTGLRKVRNLQDATGIVYDKVDAQFKFNGNDTIRVLADTSTAQTFTNKTITSPIDSDLKVLASPSITYTSNVTAAVITGFSWTVAAAGTYQFEVNLPTTMTTVGGLAISFKLTTATLASIQYQSYAATASDNTTAVSTQGTTTTDATKVFDSKTAAYTLVNIKGSFVTTLGGTFAWYGCQNTSASGGDVTVILLGAYAILKRSV